MVVNIIVRSTILNIRSWSEERLVTTYRALTLGEMIVCLGAELLRCSMTIWPAMLSWSGGGCSCAPNVLQACMPSSHVCSKFGSPGMPHLSTHAPPRAQQLRRPECFLDPHLGHTGSRLVVVVVVVTVDAEAVSARGLMGNGMRAW